MSLLLRLKIIYVLNQCVHINDRDLCEINQCIGLQDSKKFLFILNNFLSKHFYIKGEKLLPNDGVQNKFRNCDINMLIRYLSKYVNIYTFILIEKLQNIFEIKQYDFIINIFRKCVFNYDDYLGIKWIVENILDEKSYKMINKYKNNMKKFVEKEIEINENLPFIKLMEFVKNYK